MAAVVTMTYNVKIKDRKGRSFEVELGIPFTSSSTDNSNSSWKALHLGRVKAKSGTCQASEDSIWGATHIMLQSKGSEVLCLEDLFGFMGTVNDSGGGYVRQAWCLGFTPGKISWELMG